MAPFEFLSVAGLRSTSANSPPVLISNGLCQSPAQLLPPRLPSPPA